MKKACLCPCEHQGLVKSSNVHFEQWEWLDGIPVPEKGVNFITGKGWLLSSLKKLMNK